MKRFIYIMCGSIVPFISVAQGTSWPLVKTEMKPATRWWWMGSAVDKDNLSYNLSEYAKKGIGGVEITPIYSVQNNDINEVPYLSAQWMGMYKHTLTEAQNLHIQVDMNNGTGWPLGGPNVTIEDAATKIIFEEYHLNEGESLKEDIVAKDEKQKSVAVLSKVMAYSDRGKVVNLTGNIVNNRLTWTAPAGKWRLIAVFNGKTLQKVKRAAHGGEGYVMNHFSQKAVINYLSKFTNAFETDKTPYPHSFFNDSYEVYGADWTPDLFEQFEQRRGYKLENYLCEFLADKKTDTTARIISDYRETLSELLLENFTQQWTSWAHRHGSTTRNQAHGSPANLIDIYAAVDIPECESFGITDFHIKGLRTDTMRKTADSDISMLKYASSAAHITGKPYVSSETFTWLTEHFRTSLSQCKPDLDLLFSSGVNRIFFHGTAYSPKEVAWPGWKFYASVDMSPTNTIWRDAQAFFEYITRCQSFLQEGTPDNEFLLYFPIYDMWYNQGGRLLMFDIHKMRQRAPQFISAVHNIINTGYDVDYISDNYLKSTTIAGNQIVTEGGTSYGAIIVDRVKFMPLNTLKHLLKLAQEGATLIFVGQYPKDVPGLHNLEQRRQEFASYIQSAFKEQNFEQTKVNTYGKGQIITGSNYASVLQSCRMQNEEMKNRYGLHCLRRTNKDGYHYFVAALKEQDTEAWITLSVNAESVMFFNPLDGSSGLAKIRKQNNGKTQIFLQLASGQSIIIKTFNKKITNTPLWQYYKRHNKSIVIDSGWKMKFAASIPSINGEFAINKLNSWTEIDTAENLKKNIGTAKYSVNVKLPNISAKEWELNLGDVRESARLKINGKDIAILWSVPFKINAGKYLKQGQNLIEIEVTNLPANRIADYDRQGIPWRIFKDINFVKLDYKKGDYAKWDVAPSGLLGPVTLTPLDIIN